MTIQHIKINEIAVKKEIKRLVHKVNGSHYNFVKHGINIQFHSVDFNEFKSFTENEFTKKYNNI